MRAQNAPETARARPKFARLRANTARSGKTGATRADCLFRLPLLTSVTLSFGPQFCARKLHNLRPKAAPKRPFRGQSWAQSVRAIAARLGKGHTSFRLASQPFFAHFVRLFCTFGHFFASLASGLLGAPFAQSKRLIESKQTRRNSSRLGAVCTLVANWPRRQSAAKRRAKSGIPERVGEPESGSGARVARQCLQTNRPVCLEPHKGHSVTWASCPQAVKQWSQAATCRPCEQIASDCVQSCWPLASCVYVFRLFARANWRETVCGVSMATKSERLGLSLALSFNLLAQLRRNKCKREKAQRRKHAHSSPAERP